MQVKSTLPLVLLALATSATFAAGCSGCDKGGDHAPDAAPAASVAPAASSAAIVAGDAGDAGDDARRRPFPVRRGNAGQFLAAAHAAGLPDETLAKLDPIEKGAGGPPDPAAREATKDLHNELVGQLKAGKIESAKLEPKYAAIDKATAAERDKDAETLNAIHAALDPAQRKTVADTVKAQQTMRDKNMASRRGGAAGAGPDGGADAGVDPKAEGKRSLDRLLRGIDIDAEQQKKVDAIAPKDDAKVHDVGEQHKREAALLEAFVKDTFDAKKLDPDAAKRSRAALEQEAKVLEKLLPILKPEQREKLAAKMEKGGGNPHGRRPGFGHRPTLEEDDSPE